MGIIIPYPDDVVIIIDPDLDCIALCQCKEIRVNPNKFAELSHQERTFIMMHESEHAWVLWHQRVVRKWEATFGLAMEDFY